MVRKHQTSDAQLRIGESRDSQGRKGAPWFDAEPVIGPRFGADPVASPRNDGCVRLRPGPAAAKMAARHHGQETFPEEPMGTHITFKRPDGKETAGYLANAARGNAPGVVVVQEWWGLSENIKGLCDRFAVAGFDALAPDLFKGKVVPYHDTDAAGKEMNSLDFMDATTQNVRGAAQYLARNGAKVGLTGFCLGGAVTIIGATKISELTAGVVFYGIPPEQAAKPADVKIPLQAHFANKDDWCTPAAVDAFEKAMKTAGKSLELFRYDAEHAFVNEQRAAVHDRQAAELAWGRATEFFKKHLG
jgi:carboxymethylenebutenolidase